MIQILAASPAAHLPADTPGRAAEDGPGPCAPLPRVGDLEEAPGSQACPGPATAGSHGGPCGSEPADATKFALFLCVSKQIGRRQAGREAGSQEETESC